MSKVEFLTDRVSYLSKADSFSIVVTAKLERWKETLLLVWVLAWTACGIYFISELFIGHPRETQLAIVVMLFFWLYFEIKIGRALLWRLWGFEQLLFSKEKFSIKRSIKGYGKRQDYFVDNILRFNKVDTPANSFLLFMENSFWVLGGEKVYFEYQGGKIALGRQLDEASCNQLVALLNKQLPKWKS